METKSKIIVLIVILILFGLGLYGAWVNRSNETSTNATTANVNADAADDNVAVVPTNQASTEANANTAPPEIKILTYRSEKLGVEFRYPEPDHVKTTFREIDGSIFVHQEGLFWKCNKYDFETSKCDFVFESDSYDSELLEVFSKPAGLSLEEAVYNEVLKKFSSEDCRVARFSWIEERGNYPRSFSFVTIEYPKNKYPEQEKNPFYHRCPNKYTPANGLSYFFSDTNAPKIFVFVGLGQDFLTIDLEKKIGWFETIRFVE